MPVRRSVRATGVRGAPNRVVMWICWTTHTLTIPMAPPDNSTLSWTQCKEESREREGEGGRDGKREGEIDMQTERQIDK